jgi:hypothetical protein
MLLMEASVRRRKPRAFLEVDFPLACEQRPLYKLRSVLSFRAGANGTVSKLSTAQLLAAPDCRPVSEISRGNRQVIADLLALDPRFTPTDQSTFRGAFPSRIPPGDIYVFQDRSVLRGDNPCWMSALA